MTNSVSYNTLIQLAGKIFSTLAGLVVVAVMTRNLGPAGFGHYTTVIAFLQTFAILTDFGLNMTASKILGEKQVPARDWLGNLLSFRTITSAATFMLAPVLGLIFPYPIIVKIGIFVTSLAFFLTSLTQSFQSVFQANLKSGYLVLADFTGRFILLVGTVAAALANSGLITYLMIYVLATTLTTISTLVFANKLMPFTWQIKPAIWRLIWQTTWPLAITIALNLIYLKADTLILAATWPAGDVGIYGAAYKVLEVLLAVPAIIGGLVLPLAARYLAVSDKNNLRLLFTNSFDALLAAGLAIVVGASLVGTPIMIILTGHEFLLAGKLLLPLGLATALIFLGNAAGYFIFAFNKQKQVIPLYVITAIIALALYFSLIPRYSYWAAAWSTVVVEAIMTVGGLIYLKKFGLTASPRRWLKIILATAFLAAGLSLPISLAGKLVTGLILYLLALWQLKLFPIKNSFSPMTNFDIKN